MRWPGRAGRTDPPKDLLASLPAHLLEAVFVAGNGELFWPVSVAQEAAAWARLRDLAIVGGEVYSPRPPFWGTFIRAWTVEQGREADEDWETVVRRCFVRAGDEVAAEPPGNTLVYLATEVEPQSSTPTSVGPGQAEHLLADEGKDQLG